MTYAKAVCVMVLRDDELLSVSRRKAPTLWGLVGGKVDDGETLKQAAVRETFEETGFQMVEDDLIEFFDDVCPGEVTYDVTTFLCMQRGPDLSELNAEEGLTLSYRPISFLSEKENSPFADYNRGIAGVLAC